MRIKQLDALRAIAVLLVLGAHAGWPQNPSLPMGWVGVDLFFVISGFLVSGLLFRDFKKSGTIHVGNFIMRRGFKIYPAYYLFVTATALAFALVGVPFAPDRILHDLIFVQNYAPGTYSHLWSLAVEEHFYIALPIVLWYLAKRKGSEPFSQLPLTCGVIAVSCLLLRIVTAVLHGGPAADITVFGTQTHLRIDSLSFGVLIAYVWEFRPRIIDKLASSGWQLLVWSLVLVSPCFVMRLESPFVHTVGYSLLYLGFGGVLIFVLRCVDAQSWIVNGLAKIGLHSYTIYLIHVPVQHFVAMHGMSSAGYNTPLVHVTYLALAICLGIMFSKMVELPFLKIREHFVPRHGAALQMV